MAPLKAPAALNMDAGVSDSPVLMEADGLTYLPEKQLVLATGHVEIAQDKRILMANEVIYDQQQNLVTARGDVSLMEPDGNVYFADEVNLKDDMKSGVISHFQARLKDGSLIAARTAERLSKDVFEMDKAVYSPCKLCEAGKAILPLWQLKAENVRLDDEEERVYYKHARMEFFGVPVLYTPYLSHASPGAARKSGFLMASYSSVSTLGVTGKFPYYWNISPNMDATITPYLTSNEGPVGIGEFRHLTTKGKYELSGSLTYPHERDELGIRTSNRDLRGHIEGHGAFDIKDDWVWGFDGKRSTDDTYLQRYKFGNEDLLTTRGYVQRLEGRNHTTMETLSFQGLNATDDPGKTPLILPLVTSHQETAPGWHGSRFIMDSDFMALERDEGVESRRLSFRGGYKIPHVTSNGHYFEFKTSLRADGYNVNNVPDPLNPTHDEEGSVGRLIPEAQLDWSFPVVRYEENMHIYLEPVANFIVSPYGNNPNKIPNEDSQDVELSDVNLFSANHFTGLDLVEDGPRTNYGLRGGVYGTDGKRMNFLFGQTYRARESEQFKEESGLRENFSDYVGRLSLNDGKNVEFSYRFRLDKDEMDFHRNEFEATLNFNPLRLSADYVMLDENVATNPDLDREEVASAISYDLSSQWTIHGYARRDLSSDGGLISAGSGLQFHNECLMVNTQFGREFTRDRDIEPSTAFTIQIGFKNLN